MFCKNCGNKIPDGFDICPTCGTFNEIEGDATSATSEANPNVVAQNIEAQPIVAENEVGAVVVNSDVEETDFAQPDFSAPQKKKSKKLWLKIGIPAVALVLVLAIVLNIGTIIGTAIKWFGSDADYFKYVEAKAIKNFNTDFADAYGEYQEAYSKDELGMESKITLTVSDELDDLLADFGADIPDLSWLNGASITVDGSKQTNLSQYIMALNIGEQKIASIDMIANVTNGATYFKIAELSDKYLKSSLEMDEESLKMFKAYFEVLNNVEELTPDKELINSLLDRYTDIVIENVQNVTKTEKTIVANGISQDCVVLEVVIDEQYLYNVCVDILNTLKTDEDIAVLFKSWQVYFDEHEDLGINDNLYDEFIEEVDEALEELKNNADEVGDSQLMTIKSYVNGSHEVIGRELYVDGQQIINYATAQKGDQIGFLAECQGVKLEGTGTEDGDCITGTYTISYQAVSLVDITLTNFNTEDGTGAIKIVPNQGVMYMLSSEISALTNLNPAFNIIIEENNFEVNVSGNNKVLLGVKFYAEEKEVSKVTEPSDANSVDVDDSEALAEWAKNVNFDTIINNIKASDIPQEYAQMIEAAIGQLTGGSNTDVYAYSF